MTRPRLPVRIIALGPHLDRQETLQWRRPVLKQDGADFMRSGQLVHLIRPHLSPDIDLTYTRVPVILFRAFATWAALQPRAVYILVRNFAYRCTPEHLATLRRRALAVGVDHVDGDISQPDLSSFDFHVAASFAGYEALKRLTAGTGAPVGLLHHHADPRITKLAFHPLPELRAGYVGWHGYVKVPPSLSREVDIMEVLHPQDMERVLPKLPDYNFHFCVRPSSPSDVGRRYKPLTKGFTAAACRSNMMINRDIDDAVAFLGDDYPYLTSDNSPSVVEEAFTRAREGFGSQEWRDGLDRMAAVAAQVSPESLARQFEAMLAPFR